MTRRDVPTVARPYRGVPEWGSDVVAEMLRRLAIPYVALMPGASFRGLHDSLVNYIGNDGPSLILCNHEEVAVAVAHGFAKMSGRAMAAAVHSTVGLMHASMTIFCAWCDRQPILVLGGTGPMDASARRPWIEWIHTADHQGELVRDFTKWEHQPASVAAMPEAMLRAWQLAHLEPRGPVYVCLDVALQEAALTAPIVMPDLASVAAPSAGAPDPDAIERAAALLVEAQHPLILLGQTSGSDAVWRSLIALAESLGAAVTTERSAITSFPTDHPLHQGAWLSASHAAVVEEIRDADVMLAIEKIDVAGTLRLRGGEPVRLVNVTLEPYATRSWSADYLELPLAEIAITSTADAAVTALEEVVRRRMADAPSARRRAEDRAKALGARSRMRRAALAAADQARRDESPIHLSRILAELRTVLGPRAADTIVAQAPLVPWPTTTWDFTRPRAFLGGDGGGGVGSNSGIAVGAALAAIGSGRPVVAVIGDGEMLAAPSALWTAAHHSIPILFVVANNQSYHNDVEHQDQVARARGRPPENRWVGQQMDTPPVSFTSLAHGMGVEAFGPITEPGHLAEAMRRAVAVVDEGRPALVDVRIASR